MMANTNNSAGAPKTPQQVSRPAPQQRCGIVLINTGTPDKPEPEAVARYLLQFLSDPNVVSSKRLIWWFVLRLIVIPRRKHPSAEKYQSIWTNEGSPLVVQHTRLARQLDACLAAEYGRAAVKVVMAMNYGKPELEQTLEQLRQEGITRLLIVPTYPQAAISTTRAVEQRVRTALRRMSWSINLELLPHYFDHPAYIDAIVRSILAQGFQPQSTDRLLFSFHSIPYEHLDAGDLYKAQVDASVQKITQELGLEDGRWELGYQSPFGDADKWLQPYSIDILRRWGREFSGRVFVVCPGFAADCLETLYDISQEFKPTFYDACASAGHTGELHAISCLGDSQIHVQMFAEILRSFLDEN